MNGRTIGRAAVAVAVTCLFVPATASAHAKPSFAGVAQHVRSADQALDLAVVALNQGRGSTGRTAFAKSRIEMARARAETQRLVRDADTGSKRARAARAQALVMREQDENVEQLLGVLDKAEGKVENEIARAALTDARGRDKAVAVLGALLQKLPAAAKDGITRAMSSVSQNRTEEVREGAAALSSPEVSAGNKKTVAATLEQVVDGQQVAAAKLAELIAKLPEAASFGLRRAYDAVTAEQEQAASILRSLPDSVPEAIRARIQALADRAAQNAQELRANRPGQPATGRP